jgi:hypothetical protein
LVFRSHMALAYGVPTKRPYEKLFSPPHNTHVHKMTKCKEW